MALPCSWYTIFVLFGNLPVAYLGEERESAVKLRGKKKSKQTPQTSQTSGTMTTLWRERSAGLSSAPGFPSLSMYSDVGVRSPPWLGGATYTGLEMPLPFAAGVLAVSLGQTQVVEWRWKMKPCGAGNRSVPHWDSDFGDLPRKFPLLLWE